MTEQKKGKIIDKIKKLISLSTSSNEHEAALAASMAQDLLNKYNLSMTEVERNEEEVGEEGIYLGGKVPTWVGQLFLNVGKMFNLKTIISYSGGSRYSNKGRKAIYNWIGTELDRQTSKFIFEYLRETIERLSENYASKEMKYGFHKRGSKLSIKRSYQLGAFYSLRDNIDKMIKEKMEATKVESSSSALVHLKNQKDIAVQSYMAKKYPVLGVKKTSGSIGDLAGYNQGSIDGKSISINKGVNGANQTKSLGY